MLFGYAIHALRVEYSESAITVKETNELQQRIDSYHEQLQQIRTQLQQRMRGTGFGVYPGLVGSSNATHAIMTELPTVQTQTDKTVQSQFKEVYTPVQSTSVEMGSEQASVQGRETPERRIQRYILEQRRQGREPPLAEIMDRCTYSKRSAIRYRRELGESAAIGARRVVDEKRSM